MPGVNRRGTNTESLLQSQRAFFVLMARDAYLNMVHVTKMSGTFLHCAVFAQPRRGVGQDARNKVGHRRGIIESERLLHGRPCDKKRLERF